MTSTPAKTLTKMPSRPSVALLTQSKAIHGRGMNTGLCPQEIWVLVLTGKYLPLRSWESFSGSLGLRGLGEMISKVSLPASIH